MTPPTPIEAPAIVDEPPPPQDHLALELAAVRDADAALRAHDPDRALELVHGVHPDQLAAELAAIEIDALCLLDRFADARALAKKFTIRFPHSTLGARVEHSCATGEKP